VKADQPTDEGYAAAAWLLGVETRAMKAVAEVEAGPQGAFLSTGEPTILFERHIFHRLTGGRFDAVAPGLSNAISGGYGKYSEQHGRLARAVKLDRDAALKSASWGLFQVMGFNHVAAGFPDLQRFINAAYRDVDDHLRMFVMFIRSDAGLVDAIRARAWDAFALRYNGPDYKRNDYAVKMGDAYQALA
jgi:hypothetical protein